MEKVAIRSIYRITVILSFCLYFICSFIPFSSAQARIADVVRIAYVPPEVDSIEFVPVAQIFKAYMDEISKYAGWKYTLMAIPPELVKEKLLSGEIDMVLPLEYYPSEDNPSIIYNKRDFINDILCFYYKEDDTFTSNHHHSMDANQHSSNNLLMVNGKRVGVLANREKLVSTADFANKNGLDITINYYPTVAAMDEALMNGEVDLIVDTVTRSSKGVKQLIAFESVPARVAAMATNQALVDQFDEALDTAWKEDEDTMYKLENLFFEKAHIITTNFTADELHYISMTSPVKIVVYGQYQPYVYLNENNDLEGIYPDILRELFNLTGLPYKIIFANTYDEAQTMVHMGLADVMIDIYNNDSSAPDLNFTNPIYEEKYTLVGMRDNGGIHQDTFIVPHTLPSLVHFIQHHMPNHAVLSAVDIRNALTQANDDPKNIAVAEMIALQSERTLLMFPKLATIPTTTLSVPLSLAISKHRQIVLRSILNKGIQRLDHQTVEQIILRYTMNSSPNVSLSYLMHYYPMHLGLGICAVLVLLTMSGFLFYNYHMTKIQHDIMAKKNEKLRQALVELQEASEARDSYRHMAQNDSLTGIYNKSGMEELCRKEFGSLKEKQIPCTFMIIDLDHFKQLNDTCGHQKGDEMLKSFALSLRSIVRRDDYIGRFGGDEFVVLLHSMESIPAIQRIASRINVAAKNLNTGHPDVRLSASIGIALAPRDGETYEDIFKKADESVYIVKENGRDGYHIYSDEDRA